MRHTKKLLGLTAVMLVAACTDNLTGPRANAAGTYTLTVHGGRSIPAHYIVQPGSNNGYPDLPNGGTLDVTGGDIVLNSNGTFAETNDLLLTPPSGSSISRTFFRTGTWTLFGETLTIASGSGSNSVHDDGTVTTDANGVMTVYYLEDIDGSGTLLPFEYKRF